MTREKEEAKLRKAQAMREVLQAAEQLAKEEKKNRWKREEHFNRDTDVVTQSSNNSNTNINDKCEEQNYSQVQKQISVKKYRLPQLIKKCFNSYKKKSKNFSKKL